MGAELTARQKELLDFIEDHVRVQGFPPSVREMAQHMGIRSTNGVHDHIKALERKGYLLRQNTMKSRAISIARKREAAVMVDADGVTAVPIVGRVAAGTPITAEENREGTVLLSPELLPRDQSIFALRVQGDSMIERGIFDCDLVFVRPQHTAESGQMVVALIEGEATVKTFRKAKGCVRFEPANPAWEPIVVQQQDFKDTQILGLVVGVFRQVRG